MNRPKVLTRSCTDRRAEFFNANGLSHELTCPTLRLASAASEIPTVANIDVAESQHSTLLPVESIISGVSTEITLYLQEILDANSKLQQVNDILQKENIDLKAALALRFNDSAPQTVTLSQIQMVSEYQYPFSSTRDTASSQTTVAYVTLAELLDDFTPGRMIVDVSSTNDQDGSTSADEPNCDDFNWSQINSKCQDVGDGGDSSTLSCAQSSAGSSPLSISELHGVTGDLQTIAGAGVPQLRNQTIQFSNDIISMPFRSK